MPSPTAFLRELFDAAVDGVSAARCVPPALPGPPLGRTVVLGAGKAAAAMAQAVEREWAGPLEGLVVTRYGHALPCRRIEVIEAAHPVPDEAGVEAALRLMALAQELGRDDLALCLLSGGGSALLTLPAAGVSLEDKRFVTAALLRCGAAIDEINAVRKHLSAIKGGRLAVACHPAPVVTLAISDVPGDDPAVIASGPTVPDPSTRAEARAVLDRYGIAAPPAVARALARPENETPKPGDSELAGTLWAPVATARVALEAAATAARAAGYEAVILDDRAEGEAREVGLKLAAIALQARREGTPASPPCVLLSGGETTVTVRGQGRGGRNTELLVSLATALESAPGIWALAADTDGIDGTVDNAGAFVTPDTLERARDLGLDPRAALAANDAYTFFAALDDLFVTGPTYTNVNDFRAILVAAGDDPPQRGQ